MMVCNTFIKTTPSLAVLKWYTTCRMRKPIFAPVQETCRLDRGLVRTDLGNSSMLFLIRARPLNDEKTSDVLRLSFDNLSDITRGVCKCLSFDSGYFLVKVQKDET